MPLKTAQYHNLCNAAAQHFGIPDWEYRGVKISGGALLEGICHGESGGRAEAWRYEPHQDRQSDGDTPNVDSGWLEDDRSWGLFQVMGYNIRRLLGAKDGTPMNFRFAIDPWINIWLGCQVLIADIAAVKRELGAVGDDPIIVSRALARYNGGPTGDDPTGPGGAMRRQVYVDHVGASCLAVVKDRGRAL
jgi:hypothetical protein